MIPLRRGPETHRDGDELKRDELGIKVLLQALGGVLVVAVAVVIGLYVRGFIRF